MMKTFKEYQNEVGKAILQKSIVLTESIETQDVGEIKLGDYEILELVTLCVDIRSSTQRSASENIHKSIVMLNKFFPTVASVLHDSGAIIDKYPGDGVMAHFVLQNNGAKRAVEAACMIRALVDLVINKQLIEENIMTVECGISIDAPGTETALACVGIPEHLEIIAVGNSVNIAAKLEKVAGNQVVIGYDVYKRIPTLLQRQCTLIESGIHYTVSQVPYPCYRVNWECIITKFMKPQKENI